MSGLRELRESAGWSREELARAAGIDRSLLALLESGEREPNAAQAALFSRLLGAQVPHRTRAGGEVVARDERGVPTRRVRRAFACGRCGARTFLRFEEPDRVPACGEHGPMTRLTNAPYRGEATPV